jgi:site-specific DNA recombinase
MEERCAARTWDACAICRQLLNEKGTEAMAKKATNRVLGKKALIYCRISSVSQEEGDGLNSQEHRCRAYAAAHGLEADAVFHDTRTGSGDFMSRPGMVKLLEYLEAHPENSYTVIFDDLKRFARDTMFHLMLRQELAAYGASVACLNFKFEDTPEGEFVETVMAAQGSLERKQNRRQTMQKMKSRMERGFYCFFAPFGYRYEKAEGGGKILVRDGRRAEIVQEAYEGLASGRFQSQGDVKRFLEAQPEFPKPDRGHVRYEEVERLLTRPVYAGLVEAPTMGVTLRKGQHEPIIGMQTWQRVQQHLQEKARVPARTDLNQDFVLRGAVHCSCGTPLTSCWAKGRSAHYAYYHCPKKGCEYYGKSIKREVIEGQFGEFLQKLKPAPALFNLACRIFKDFWDEQAQLNEVSARALKAEIKQIGAQIEGMLENIVHAESPLVMSAFEKRISKLAQEKLVHEERIKNCGRPVRDFDESLSTALGFLADPAQLWMSDQFEDKRAVLKLVFSKPISYVRGKGFLEPELSLPFKALGEFAPESEKWRRGRDSNPRRDVMPSTDFESVPL